MIPTVWQGVSLYLSIGLGMWLGLIASDGLRRAMKPKARDLIASMFLIPLWPAGLYIILKDSK